MFPQQFPRALAPHDPHGGGIHLQDLVLVVKDDSVTGAFEERAELFFRLTQRLLRALALGVFNDAGANQILSLRRQAQQPDLGWDETAVGLLVNPFKNWIASRQGLSHYFA